MAKSSKGLLVRRGEQWMSEDELRAHLAAIVRLENVAIFLGAGASCGELGGMTLSQVWDFFESNYSDDADWLEENEFISRDLNSINVEELADSLQVALLEWNRSGHEEKQRLAEVIENIKRSIFQAAILLQDLWKNPHRVEALPKELHAHRNTLQKICSARQPGQAYPYVFTTNYDLAVEWAAESLGLHIINGFSGMHFRSFSPSHFDLGFRNTRARGEASNGTYNIALVKLHGSLSWRTRADAVIESSCRSLWQNLKKFIDGGESPAEFLVLPGALKYQQTAGFVFGELFRRFSEFLSRPQASLIICGYSFADEHLNRVIQMALHNPTLQLVIVLPELEAEGGSWKLAKTKPWVRKVAELQLPQITLVGGGEASHFTEFVKYLPDSALFDEQSHAIRAYLKAWNAQPSLHEDAE